MQHCLLAAVFLLTSSAGAAPQATGLGTIGGQVVGLNSKPVDRARVTLQSSDGSHPQTAQTNAQGRFWFPSLPSGLYELRAHSKGYSSEWRHNVWVNRGQQTSVTLRLRSKKSAPNKGSAPAQHR